MVHPRKSTNARHVNVLWNYIQKVTSSCYTSCCRGSTTPSSSSRTKVQMRTLRILIVLVLLLVLFFFKTVMIMTTTTITPIPFPETATETITTAHTTATTRIQSTTDVLRQAPQSTIGSVQSTLEELTQHDTSTTSSVQEHDKINDSLRRRHDHNNATTIAYAISLVKCGDHQTNAAGLTDAALILRHSIHVISSRNPESHSKYDYVMVAIVHRQAVPCSDILRKVGFQIMIVDSPVQRQEIQGEYLKQHIRKEWCCGHGELITMTFGMSTPNAIDTSPQTRTNTPNVAHICCFMNPLPDPSILSLSRH